MSKLLCYSLLRHLIRHPWQLASSLLGIALGVAVVLAVDLANYSARQSFQFAADQLSGEATHRIVGGREGVAEQFYVELKKQGVLARLAPLVIGNVAPAAEPDRTLRIMGIDPFATPFLSALQPAGSAYSAAAGVTISRLLTQPDSVIVPRDVAYDETLDILAGASSIRLHPIAQVDDVRLDGLLITDISTAQALFRRQGRLDSINLFLPAGDVGRRLIERIEQQLPPGLTLERIDEADQSLSELSASFSLNLTAMSLLALLVGMFLIYNTMTFAVVQRRPLIGILRALGASRKELILIILGEALLLGLIGTLLGVLLGLWLGSGLVHLVTRTINDLYYPLPATLFDISAVSLLKVLCLGVLAALAAAWLPAYEAGRVAPGDAMRRAHLELRWRLRLPRLNAAGLLLMALGGGLLWWSGGLAAGFAGLFLIITGAALLTPWCVVGLTRLLQRPARGLTMKMALRGISRHLSRTGIAVAALTVAFAATVGVGVMVHSFRSGVIDWLGEQLTADLYITAANSEHGEPLQPALLERLHSLPGVRALSSYRWLSVRLDGKPTRMAAVDMAPASQAGYRLLSGDPVQAWRDFASGPALMISEPLAYHRRLTAGDAISLDTPAGERSFTIAGIFHDYSSEHGRILMHRSSYRQFWHDDSITSVAVFTEPAQDATKLRRRIEQAAASIQRVRVRANRELYELTLAVFDRTFVITHVLRLLAIVIAFIGILSALMALQLERAREIATLRAIGIGVGQIGRMTCLQTGLLGLFAGVMAIPLGLLLAALLIFVINRRAFGWTLPFQVDVGILYQSVVLAVAGALLASVYPLWKQRHIHPAAALRTE